MKFEDLTGFQWDKGNETKNWESHAVTKYESEQVFFNEPLLVYDDVKHSDLESRHFVLGRTDAGRRLMIVFTTRDDLVRVISARDMSKNERAIYEKHT
jgi:uncharacterized DUF497 family protein